MKKSLSLFLALALLTGLSLRALADGNDAVLALYVQNEGNPCDFWEADIEVNREWQCTAIGIRSTAVKMQ